MAKFDSLLFDSGFAVGSSIYEDFYAGYGSQNHIVVTLALNQDKSLSIRAIIDTGAKWCIVDPAIAEDWEKHFFNVYDPHETMRIRGIEFNGKIAHADIVLNASNGSDLILTARFFIPRLSPHQIWNMPNFIGLDGMLNYMRFAIDPSESVVYFGKI
jgi:predicted aspartyl protease